MIQQPHARPAVAAARALALALLTATTGCGRAPIKTGVPRTLAGQLRSSPFVPPFAYEAYVRGELALARGEYSLAVTQFELATAAPEEDPFLLARLAYAQALAGQRPEAEKTLRHATKVDACSEAVWLTRGELMERDEKLPEAAMAYARASECAPNSSRAAVARAKVLDAAGKRSEALEALGSCSGASHPDTGRVGFELALRSADPAALAHALDTWIAYQAPDPNSLERAIRWSLEHGQPALAQRIAEHHKQPLPPALEADLLRALGDRPALARLIARTPASDLGGAAATARLAVLAGDYDRADLEASAALQREPSDALLAVRAQARVALGQTGAALTDLAGIRDLSLRRQTLLDLLVLAGEPALAKDLAVLALDPARSE